MTSEKMPTVPKYDPEYDAATSAQCFRAHAKLIFETAEAPTDFERPAFSNYLTHVRELLLFTLGWLEQGLSPESEAKIGPLVEMVRQMLGRIRSSKMVSNEAFVALGHCFEDLADSLESL
jgi:hypothetical protein